MKQLVPALKLLVDHRYIFEMPVVTHTGPGRPPSPMFETNPVLRGGVAVASGADPDLDSEYSEDCEEDLVF